MRPAAFKASEQTCHLGLVVMPKVKTQRPNEASYRAESYHILKPVFCGAFWLHCEVMSLQSKRARE